MPVSTAPTTAPNGENGGGATTKEYKHAKTALKSEVNGAKGNNASEMIALLTGTQTNTVALANFHYAKPNLYYSLYLSGEGVERIYSVLFKDASGVPLLVQKAVSQQFVESDHYCGLWERLPRDHRRMLVQEQIKFAVNTSSGILEGSIVLRTPNFEYQFSALLAPERSNISSTIVSGYAAIGMHGRASPLHLYAEMEISPAIAARILPSATGSYAVQAHIIRPDEAITLVQTTTQATLLSKTRLVINARLDPLSSQEGKWMARRKLHLRLYSPELFGSLTIIVGDIVTQPTCSVFQAILYEPERRSTTLTTNLPAAAGGLALLRLRKDGSMQYWVHVEGMAADENNNNNQLTQLTIESEPKRKTRRRQVEDITNVYSAGWANGTYEKPKARDIKLLLTDKLYVNAATKLNPNAVQGSLRQLLFQPTHLSTFPSLILEQHVPSTNTQPPPPPGAGAVWLRIDEHCVLHYDIYVDGYEKELVQRFAAFLTVSYVNEYGLAESSRFPLEQFEELKSSGKVKSIRRDAMRRLLDGTITLDIIFPGELQPRLASTARVVNDCARETSNKYNFLGIAAEQATSLKPPPGDGSSSDHRNKQQYECQYEGQVYKEGEGWRSSSDACAMCSCRRGRVRCDAVICPALDCPNNIAPMQTSSGECCPRCAPRESPLAAVNTTPVAAALSAAGQFAGEAQNAIARSTDDARKMEQPTSIDANSGGGCIFHHKWRKLGEQWHPYLPTFGFSPCVLCVCEMNATIACKRKACPALPCDESEAIRRNAGDCCKSCPERKQTGITKNGNLDELARQSTQDKHHHQTSGTMSDAPQSLAKSAALSAYSPNDILNRGGCQFQSAFYENGNEWHPKVLPFGLLKCIKCMCKDGQSHCRRQKCPILTCHYIVIDGDDCCPQCARKDNPDARPNRRWRRHRRQHQRVLSTFAMDRTAVASSPPLLDEES